MSNPELWSDDSDWEDDWSSSDLSPDEVAIASLAYFLTQLEEFFGTPVVIADMYDPPVRDSVYALKAAGANFFIPQDN